MDCISRTDKANNLFVEEKDGYGRWNLYSQIAIEKDKLRCSNQVYDLTEVCKDQNLAGVQLCTLLDTNEVVNIGFEYAY